MRRRGFTLIELLVVIAIIAVLVALLLPAAPAGTPAVNSDMSSVDEDDGGPTFAAVASRSYHPRGVNAHFVDGSVKLIKGTINWLTWRSLGTIAGGEVVDGNAY